MPEVSESELVLVVDVSSFTQKGFIGSTSLGGQRIDVEFEDADEGVTLTTDAAKRLHVRKGSPLAIYVEGDRVQEFKTTAAGVGKVLRISHSKAYYAVGKEGGAIVRIRKA
ncbi:MAG: hypothetical protein OK438_05670 [Thaumarchaeota archaeon]|nr:hypothetical protein [Nitrososphaerota archaeon]